MDKPLNIPVSVVGYEESRDVEPTYDGSGKTVAITPVEGSDRAFLTLRLPSGLDVRAEIPHQQLDAVLRSG